MWYKRLTPFFLLFFLMGILACSSKKSSTQSNDQLFGNAERATNPNQENRDVEAEPEPEPEPETPLEEPVCDPIEILTPELPEAIAGEEYDFAISLRGGCGPFDCTLVSAMDWLELDGCRLSGTPLTEETFGEYPVQIKVINLQDESNFDEQTYSLTVRDEPKIALFVASIDFSAQKKLEKGTVYNSKEENFEITQRRHALYAKVIGHARDYTLTDDNEDVTVEALEDNIFKFSVAEDVLGSAGEVLLSDITIHAQDNYDHEVSRTFTLHVFKNPCDNPLKIKPVYLHKADGYGDTNRVDEIQEVNNTEGKTEGKIDVVVGSRYTIWFQALGAGGPYHWDYSKAIAMDSEEALAGSFDSPLTENNNWEAIPPDDDRWALPSSLGATPEDLQNNAYFQLQTSFSFPENDLPWFGEGSIIDQLHVTVEAEACRAEEGKAFEADYFLDHRFILRGENTSQIQCRQSITDVGATARDSTLSIFFLKGEEKICELDYPIHDCREEESVCEDPKPVQCQQSVAIEEIDSVGILFADNAPHDNFCGVFDDCDNYQADYDLITLTCYTPFRKFRFHDGEGGQIDQNVVPDEESFWERNTNRASIAITIIGTPLAGAAAATTFWSMDQIFGFMDDGLERRLYPLYTLDPNLWKPRLRPDYPEPSE